MPWLAGGVGTSKPVRAEALPWRVRFPSASATSTFADRKRRAGIGPDRPIPAFANALSTTSLTAHPERVVQGVSGTAQRLGQAVHVGPQGEPGVPVPEDRRDVVGRHPASASQEPTVCRSVCTWTVAGSPARRTSARKAPDR
jgi:hypothetical protein